MTFTTNPQANYAIKIINQTARSVFLTGKAGTGKTTLLRQILSQTPKNTMVVAPTGIAALNAGGTTIHSMFQLASMGYIPDSHFNGDLSQVPMETEYNLYRGYKMTAPRQSVIRSMELLVIDEVSMLRADLLDAMDLILRKIRKNPQPMGGVQLLFIGDLQQLPPVVKQEEWNILKSYYQGMFFFHAHVMKKMNPLYIELKKIYRQKDADLISLLNALRQNTVKRENIDLLNQYARIDYESYLDNNYIFLTTHNYKAHDINARKLNQISEKSFSYRAEIKDNFPEKMYPLNPVLTLKKGARVMFVKNDIGEEKRYYNGKMAVVESLSEEEIWVTFEDGTRIEVDKYEWTNVRFKVNPNNREIDEEIQGTFTHYPLKLAWAITVHKSQGLTFEKAILDINDVFQPGQAYVALSRLTGLSGLVLTDQIRIREIKNAEDVLNYARLETTEEELRQTLKEDTVRYIYVKLTNHFDFSDLLESWKKHFRTFSVAPEHSEKKISEKWAQEINSSVSEIHSVSQKFLHWLKTFFSQEEKDFNFLKERIEAAYVFFFEKLDPLLAQFIEKISDLKKKKKSKEFLKEVKELDEILTKNILELSKVKNICIQIIMNKEVTRDLVIDDFIKNYKLNKVKQVLKDVNKKNHVIQEDWIRDDITDYIKPLKSVKKVKESTYDKTLRLWLSGKNMADIARERKVAMSTVESHLARLISEGKVSIYDVISEDKISELDHIFDIFPESLTEARDKSGNTFTFGALRMYRNHKFRKISLLE